ncbi:MAG: FtsX-like permease family protein [Gordonia sp. (in: high G+C Gram-positive bacteria)]|uniref:ABC transporter permease n=1 Tax=Gordonia sp. (in: high G+C Gram-positive bacteria) TaxID=84139 RepID=UPI0039E6A9DF
MRRVSVRNLAAHKVRLFLTIFSVVLGTSFVAGSIIFTSSISNAFTSIFDKTAQGVAVQVAPKNPSAIQASGAQVSPGVPNSIVSTIVANREQLGYDRLSINYNGLVAVAQADGKPLQTGNAPSIGTTYLSPSEAVAKAENTILPGGRGPRRPGEVAINKTAADKAGLKVGSRTRVVAGQGTSEPLDVKVVGLLDWPVEVGGFVNVAFDEDTARQLYSDGSHSGTVQLSAQDGVSDDELARRVRNLLGPTALKIQTGDEVRQESKDAINKFLQIFTYILLAFAGIGIIVGTFIIYNTFAMIVAQRNRELALLRAIGASEGQVSRSVLTEAFLVGLVGSAIGLVVGIGLAAGLRAIAIATTGLPDGGLRITPTAIIAALVVGVVVTMLSAWLPARRAARVAPVEAMRSTMAEPKSLHSRTVVGVLFAAAGIAITVAAALHQGVGPALAVGLGAVLLIVAVVLTAPALSRPFLAVIGVITLPFGKLGHLARTNAARNPRRTAATAFALTIGLMLVAVIGTLGSTFKATVDESLDKNVKADFFVTGVNNLPVPPPVLQAVKNTDGVDEAVGTGLAVSTVDDKQVMGRGVMGGKLRDLINYKIVDGEDVTDDGMIVDAPTARGQGWDPGTTVTFTRGDGTTVDIPVVGVFERSDGLGSWLLGSDAYNQVVPQASQMMLGVFVKAADGTDKAALQRRLADATSKYLTVQVQTADQYKSSVSSLIDQMLGVLYAMLGLALLIAVLGIVNTLALSVVERRQEIGMQRAIGMVRPQVRRMIYLESVLIALFGATLGVLLGVGLAIAVVRTLREWGIGNPVLPWSLIVITLVGAAIVGVVAAVWPAIRAARTKPLDAIAGE